MNIDDTRFKIKALIALARTTTDICQRERYCRETKMLLDTLEPAVIYDDSNQPDLVMQFLNDNYEITFENTDRVFKGEFDKAFFKWNIGREYQLSKKELTTRMIQIGLRYNRKGVIGDKHGYPVYEGIKEKTWQR